MLRVAALTFLCFVLVVPAAPGATATVEGTTLRLTASPGELNLVVVRSVLLPGAVEVSDGGAPLVAGPGCAPEDWGLTCSGVDAVEADLGDGDDQLLADELLLSSISIAGGTGDDELTGSPGDDRIDGQEGRDQIFCEGGLDTVRAEVLDELDFACERVDYGPPGNPGHLRLLSGGGRFVAIPGMPWASIDRRLVPSLMHLVRRYHVVVGDGYALAGHKRYGEYPLGLAVDLYPGAGGSWRDVARLARFAEPRQNRPRPPFRWVGWSGDNNHGPPSTCKPSRGCTPHLHLSWAHSPGVPGRPVKRVWVFDVRGAP